MNKLAPWLIFFVYIFLHSSVVAAPNSFLQPLYMLLLNNQDQTSYYLTVLKSGNGLVTSEPAGISCGNDCSESYSSAEVVTITAVAAADSTFAGWSGGGCSGTGNCVVTVNDAIIVIAEFISNNPQLTVEPVGSGRVTSVDFTCESGSQCTEGYPNGTKVTLMAVPESSTFMGWQVTGSNPYECSGNTTTCTITMDETKTVTTVFDQLPIVPESTEPENDNADTADPVALDNIITGNLIGALDQDWFSVFTDDVKTVTVRFNLMGEYAPLGDGNNWRIQVWQKNSPAPDVMLTVVTVADGDTMNFTLPAAGTFYFVVVYNEDAFEGYDDLVYQLTLLSNDGFEVDPAELEPNDDQSTGNVLSFDTTIHGSVMTLTDQDWYVVTTDTDKTASIAFTGEVFDPAFGDWIVSVYPSDGTTVLSRIEVKDGTEFNIAMPALGSPYYIVVEDVPSTIYPTEYNGKAYTLTLRSNDGQQMPVAEQEPNDVYTSATVVDITSNTAVMTGQSLSKTDVDWFRFDMASQQVINVTFFESTTIIKTHWQVILYDLQNNQLNNFFGFNGSGLNNISLEAGSYYFKIVPYLVYAPFSSAQYGIEISVQ